MGAKRQLHRCVSWFYYDLPIAHIITGFLMNNRSWQILCWNIQGLNGRDKWDAVKTKIDESACVVLCLQETKRAHFDKAFIRNFALRRFDSFDYIPSEGALGGLLLLWNSSIFSATIIDKHHFAIMATFCSVHNSNTWNLSIVYGPYQEPKRSKFIQWFRAHQISEMITGFLWVTSTSIIL